MITRELFDELKRKPTFEKMDSYEGRAVLTTEVFDALNLATSTAEVSACRVQLSAIKQYGAAQVTSLEKNWFVKYMQDLEGQIRELQRDRTGGAQRVSDSSALPRLDSLKSDSTH